MTKPLQTILTIDDDDDIRLIGRMILEKKGGFRVEAKSSGQEGLAYLQSLSDEDLPDMILLDVMMPGMDGPQTLGEIRSQSEAIRQIPISFLTAKCQPDEVERLKSLGAVGVISKPFDSNSFADEVLQLWTKAHDQ